MKSSASPRKAMLATRKLFSLCRGSRTLPSTLPLRVPAKVSSRSLPFRFDGSVTFHAGLVEKRFDVFFEGEVLLIGRRRQLADIDIHGVRQQRNPERAD